MRIGIRREDKHQWEARVPLTPEGVQKLTQQGVEVVVQPSPIRAFTEDAYRSAGAEISEDLTSCTWVLAVKEIPIELLRPGGAYVFFSHTIKGQPHNMPLLRRLMELGCTLIDYERVVNDEGRRLIFFGRHAGLAGMIDTLAVLGQRLAALGRSSPWQALRLAHQYNSLQEAKAALRSLHYQGAEPFVVGFTGAGNVSKGAREIFDLLEPKEVAPEELKNLREPGLYATMFREQHLVEKIDAPGEPFEAQEYFANPQHFRSIFERYLPHLDVLINGIYWIDAYPRLLTRAFLRENPLPRLAVVGDISCDIEGSIEVTVKATTPGAPAYVYNPRTGEIRDGVAGEGLCMMTTDCLPCELPKESSSAFTQALLPFVPQLAQVAPTGEFAAAELPPPLRRATILWRGELTPDYAYLRQFL